MSNRSHSEDNEIVCQCNQEAIQLTVRKDGANKGRKFYKCKNQTCDFFLWASEDGNATRVVTHTDDNELKCNCDTPAVRRTVSKEGPNKVRTFYCCPKPMGQGCGFFQWADEVSVTCLCQKFTDSCVDFNRMMIAAEAEAATAATITTTEA